MGLRKDILYTPLDDHRIYFAPLFLEDDDRMIIARFSNHSLDQLSKILWKKIQQLVSAISSIAEQFFLKFSTVDQKLFNDLLNVSNEKISNYIRPFFLSKFSPIYALPRSRQTWRNINLYMLNPTRISMPGKEKGPQEQVIKGQGGSNSLGRIEGQD